MSSIERRTFLRGGLAAAALGTAGASAACSTSPVAPAAPAAASGGGLIGPDSPQVAAAEAARHGTGRVVPAVLDAVQGPVDLGGVTVRTWSYQGEIPGPEIRVRKGDTVQAALANRLPDPTTVHWHGIAIRNNMDGVPGMTQAPVAAGRDFTYRFTAADPGALRFGMRPGQRVRVVFANTTTMYHPMHIHGHTFALSGAGTRKDTVIVLPNQAVACDFDAGNPGQWMSHCHNLYHASESGMMAVLGYQA